MLSKPQLRSHLVAEFAGLAVEPCPPDRISRRISPPTVGALGEAEVGVQIIERWILARLRHQSFFLLVEVNNTPTLKPSK
ncbi:MAG: hypothetical protein GY820_06330 [Gammaproteobacteria bacterium]|nr:hypothetical protein [Gammaproteobacteria bacterium]